MLGNRQIDEQKTREHFLSSRAKQKEKDSADETELRSLKKRLSELDKLIASTFEEKVLGSLPENVCKDLCEKFFSEKESASRRISDLEKSLQQDSAEEEAEKYLLRLKQYANCKDLTEKKACTEHPARSTFIINFPFPNSLHDQKIFSHKTPALQVQTGQQAPQV